MTRKGRHVWEIVAATICDFARDFELTRSRTEGSIGRSSVALNPAPTGRICFDLQKKGEWEK